MANNKITFCGQECEVVKRYELDDDYMEANQLDYKKRIRFITPSGNVIDCADTF